MQLETEIKFPNPVSPDTMKDPIPVGINVNISDKFQEYYSYGNEDGFFGVVANTHNTENVSALIAYLFGE